MKQGDKSRQLATKLLDKTKYISKIEDELNQSKREQALLLDELNTEKDKISVYNSKSWWYRMWHKVE